MMTEQVPKIAEMTKVIDAARNSGNLIFVMVNGVAHQQHRTSPRA